MSSTFLFDMVMVALYPLMGKALGMNDIAYGIWAGTSVNDTASVVASGYAFSEAAGDFATMVKLTRTIAIIPTSAYSSRQKPCRPGDGPYPGKR